jgi:hypothetical protein
MTIRRGSMLVIAFLLASPGTAAAWGSDCKFTTDRSASADTRGIEREIPRADADQAAAGR